MVQHDGEHATMTEKTDPIAPDLRALGYKTMRSMIDGVVPTGDGSDVSFRDGRIGDEIVEIGLYAVFGALWAREGLSRRDRSLVTMSILIALGADEELQSHVRFAITNGLTRDEIAEVIYHTAGYAGFPRATAARTAARKALGDE